MAFKTEGDKDSNMGWGAAIGAALGVGGGLFGNYLNSREMRKQREWMEKMSNTAHQREVEDLRNAGLNPILSATGGNGASTPQGQLIPMEDPIEKGINSALAIRQQQSTIGLQDAQADQAVTQSQVNSATAKQAAEQTALIKEQQNVARATVRQIEEQTKAIPSQVRLNDANANSSPYRIAESSGILPVVRNWLNGRDKTESKTGVPATVIDGSNKFFKQPNSALDSFNQGFKSYLKNVGNTWKAKGTGD